MMNQSKYQQLLQQRFGQDSPMKTVRFPQLDAAAGASEANRELQLGQAGLNKRRMDTSTALAKQRLGLGRQRYAMSEDAYEDEKSNMNAANWVSGGGVVLGLGQGLNEAKQYRELSDLLNKQSGQLLQAPIDAALDETGVFQNERDYRELQKPRISPTDYGIGRGLNKWGLGGM